MWKHAVEMKRNLSTKDKREVTVGKGRRFMKRFFFFKIVKLTVYLYNDGETPGGS